MGREFLTCARQMLEYRCRDLEDAYSIELWGVGKKLKVVFRDERVRKR